VCSESLLKLKNFQLLLIDEGEVLTNRRKNFNVWKVPENLSEASIQRHVARVVLANIRPKGILPRAIIVFCLY
jgi:hypothetical protein